MGRWLSKFKNSPENGFTEKKTPDHPIDHEAEAKKAREFLEKRGWVAIESRTLGGEVVIWVKDAKVAIPARWKGAVTYTLAELEALAGVTPEGLKKLHRAKKTFGGKIGPSGEEF